MTKPWEEIAPGAFLSVMFSQVECENLLQSVRNQAHSDTARSDHPNSMQEYGVVVRDGALSASFDRWANEELRETVKALFPHFPHPVFSDHHSFLTSYSTEANSDLALHVDVSHMTLNICLESDAEGAELVFSGVRCAQHLDSAPDKDVVTHTFKQGDALLHVGNQRHRVTPLVSGERHSLVVWYRLAREECNHRAAWSRQVCPVCQD